MGTVEPPPSRWNFPTAEHYTPEEDLVCVGGDLDASTLLAAYRMGLFPMRVGRRRNQMGWWSPDPRGVLPLDGLHVSRTLRRSLPKFEIRIDSAFTQVMRSCGDPSRPHGWIDEQFISAYTRLHKMGWAHSVECWQGNELVGGLYGVAIGGLFAGESKFHTVTDASKAAVVATVGVLRSGGFSLFDVQWRTDHLATLGVIAIPRASYLARLAVAIRSNGTFGTPAGTEEWTASDWEA